MSAPPKWRAREAFLAKMHAFGWEVARKCGPARARQEGQNVRAQARRSGAAATPGSPRPAKAAAATKTTAAAAAGAGAAALGNSAPIVAIWGARCSHRLRAGRLLEREDCTTTPRRTAAARDAARCGAQGLLR